MHEPMQRYVGSEWENEAGAGHRHAFFREQQQAIGPGGAAYELGRYDAARSLATAADELRAALRVI